MSKMIHQTTRAIGQVALNGLKIDAKHPKVRCTMSIERKKGPQNIGENV